MIDAAIAETQPLAILVSRVGTNSRVHELVRCPFCEAEVWTHRWSRCGSGKRCACGALLCAAHAVKRSPQRPLSDADRAWALSTHVGTCVDGRAKDCPVVVERDGAPIVCPCDCRGCERAWFAMKQPVVRDGKLVFHK